MCVNSLITSLQLKKMSVIYQSAHVAKFTLQLLEMSSITTPNQTISNIHTRFTFFKKISNFTDLQNEKNPCKRNRFGYWNFCKRLPNFVNMADLIMTGSAFRRQYALCV